MYSKLIEWDIYEIKTQESTIHGVMFRGRIRKYAVLHSRNILTENASDEQNIVRFAIPSEEKIGDLETFILSLVADASIHKVRSSVPNPVLSKLKVNIKDRYTI